ncbi:MAG: ABC transporter permease [Bryobacteraceae bacterium]|nr:ABC transporter permease [Bryobacteraceae bacterium]
MVSSPPRHTASFGEAVRVAAQSLRSSKLRSFLTLLGIILSTTTLIAVMSVIHGMDRYIAESVSDMGSDGFRVVRFAFIGNWDPKKYLEFQRKNPWLNRDEFAFLRQRAHLISDIGLQTGRSADLRYGSERVDAARVEGVTANVGAMSNYQAAQGRFISEVENDKKLWRCFIGSEVKDRLFPNTDAVGKTISVNGRAFEVVGVSKPLGSVFGQSRDSFVVVPIEVFFQMYGRRVQMAYLAKAIDQGHHLQAQDEVRALLRAYRHLTPGADDTFAVISSDSLSGAWANMTGAIAATAIAVVSVFMVVGGVVIMNIMLAVVSERTQEIGIRKSLGARKRDILNQFLAESSMLSGSGGLIGVGIAWLITLIVSQTTPIPMSMPFSAVVLAVSMSVAVGLFFGIYPARRAAKLDPIEALRVER